ncbi:MAG: hypothetical protein JNK14_13500 [Chitinophagaceae bacterium]|nr:hypothetical protein [Chitinophagaceae bacterium]
MTAITTIAKKPVRLPSQDYEGLRKEGLRHIEALSGSLWTDYNSHDPGITILEALCYAITELGYRCGFDIKDLAVPAGSAPDTQALFSAKTILTTRPLTIPDYRKLLIDIKGVHNAWLLADDVQAGKKAVNEVPLYADFKTDELTEQPTPVPLFLSGLYRVLLDLEYDDLYGDMNTGDIVLLNPAITNFAAGEFMLSFEFPSLENADLVFAAKAAETPSHITGTTVSLVNTRWRAKITLDDASSFPFDITIPLKPADKTVDAGVITEVLQSPFVHIVFDQYLRKLEMAARIIKIAVKKLQENRNLCEDFLSVKTIRSEEISFCFDTDVLPSADIEKVQAEIFFAIESYLNPPVQFNSLRELLDKKVPVDEIFNAPVLEHGFIDNKQLQQTQLRTVVRTSDIINLLMDIEGVLAIRNFVMTKYDEDGKAVPGHTGIPWCMHITPLHKPVLSAERSKIILFKNQFPFLARYNEVRDTLLLLHAQRERGKLSGSQQDLPFPYGNKRDTESYWPVQYDLPQTYGVGENGLPSGATVQRKEQQQRLKAYLMFYEQLLADFLSQLTHAPALFSIADITHTYHAQFLDGIKDMEYVYRKDEDEEIVLLKDIITHPGPATEGISEWERLYEPRSLFEDRRNRFLDHLLARFAESFNEYALMMYQVNYEERTEEKINFKELVLAKTDTLKNYPAISSGRAGAYNYFPQDEDFNIDSSRLWDTNNVSGLERRICKLTGIKDETRRFLYCIRNIDITCEEIEVEDQLKCFHSFRFASPKGIVMHSTTKYPHKAEAEKAVLKVIELGNKKENYIYIADQKKLSLQDGNQPLAETEKPFANKEEALQAAREFAGAFSAECNDPVGLHLLEHILLRPRPKIADKKFDLMQVCLRNGECPCDMDPYTFRASVILPCWPGHFDNMSFREYFENKIREEAPAHIMLKICWLSNDLMRDFEVRYKTWTEALVTYTKDKNEAALAETFRKANNGMLEILTQLHSEYPKATLHNCDESRDGSNTVILGKTVLGTFKNE